MLSGRLSFVFQGCQLLVNEPEIVERYNEYITELFDDPDRVNQRIDFSDHLIEKGI